MGFSDLVEGKPLPGAKRLARARTVEHLTGASRDLRERGGRTFRPWPDLSTLGAVTGPIGLGLAGVGTASLAGKGLKFLANPPLLIASIAARSGPVGRGRAAKN